MPSTPNYGFNRNSRFSANQLAEYLSVSNARQREAVIRSAKFPRKPSVVPYSEGRHIIRTFLGRNTGDLTYFDRALRSLDTRLRREPDGWTRDELRRNVEAIQAFKRAFSRRRVRRYRFGAGPVDHAMRLEGVRINVRLDVSVIETDEDGTEYSGGCVLFLASTDNARKKVEERCKTVAALVNWTLQEANPNIEPLPRLCMSFDVFGEAITKAPTAIDRLRTHIESSCHEAASRWDRVEPPQGYDGPDWR